MTAPDRVSLDLVFDVRPTSAWWKDGRVGSALVEGLADTGLWLNFKFYGRSGGRLTRIQRPEDLETLFRRWKPGGYSLLQDGRDPYGSPALSVNVREGYFDLNLAAAGEELKKRWATLLESFAGFGRRLFGALSGIATCSQGFTTLDEPWPRPRPPRIQTLSFTPGSLLDLFDLDYIRQQGADRQAEAVARAPLPPGATRTQDRRLILIRWARDVADLASLEAARIAQERWLIAEVGLDRDPSYSEEGDLLEDAEGVEEHPLVTFYGPSGQVGYKAVVPPTLDPGQWAEMEGWARNRRLPDGTPLERLCLIVPRRGLALELLPRARRAGIDAVLYTDNQGRWWNPAPPGKWLDQG